MRYPLAGLLLLCGLAACMPIEQEFKPIASDPVIQKEIFFAPDAAELHFRSWLPKRKPKAIVIALHGFNDYSNGFIRMGEFFKRRGIATYAYDQRGFGASPQAGIWPGEGNLARDAAAFTTLLHARYPDTPIFLLGESMGAAVVMIASAQKDIPDISGLVLVSPAVWGSETIHPLQRMILWTAAHTVPAEQFTGSDLNILATNNIPVLRRMGDDPLVIKATRVDAIYGVVGLMDSAYQQADKVKPPVLLLYGGNDQVIPLPPVESVVRRLPKPFDVAYYEDGYHMLTRDIQGDVVLADTANWILKHSQKLNR